MRPRAIAAQVLGGELRRQRLDPEALGQVGVARVGAEQQVAGAEAPRVDVHEPMAVVELDRDTRVCGGSAVGIEQQRAGHPQVHEQEALVRELPDEVLAARARRARTSAPAQLVGDGSADREGGSSAESRISTSMERAALEMRRELAADRLDFGQLGHRPIDS